MSHGTCHTCACHCPTQVTWPVGHVTWEGRREGGMERGDLQKKIVCTQLTDIMTNRLNLPIWLIQWKGHTNLFGMSINSDNLPPPLFYLLLLVHIFFLVHLIPCVYLILLVHIHFLVHLLAPTLASPPNLPSPYTPARPPNNKNASFSWIQYCPCNVNHLLHW